MRMFLAVAAVALAALAGCGDDDDTDSPAQPSLSERVSSWRGAANSFNSFLQTCQVRGGDEGEAIIATCTGQARRAYERENARLQQALAATRASSPECQQAVAQVKSVSAEATDRLTLAYRSYVAAERANLAGRESDYKGPAVIPLLTRTDAFVERQVKRVDALARTIREACEA